VNRIISKETGDSLAGGTRRARDAATAALHPGRSAGHHGGVNEDTSAARGFGQAEEGAETKGGKEAMTMTSALLMMLAETVALGAMFWVGWTMWPRNRGSRLVD